MLAIQDIYDTLYSHYGPQGWWPVLDCETGNCVYKSDHINSDKERFEIAIGAILTQNVSWKNVEKALHNLSLHGLLDMAALHKASPKEIAPLIRPAGYFNQKTKKLAYFTSWLADYNFSFNEIKEKSSDIRKELLAIWGVGPETADSILLYAFDVPIFVVDAYTRRIFLRIGILNGDETYDQIQHLFQVELKRDLGVYNEYHALIVAHAKTICTKVPECSICPLSAGCLQLY